MPALNRFKELCNAQLFQHVGAELVDVCLGDADREEVFLNTVGEGLTLVYEVVPDVVCGELIIHGAVHLGLFSVGCGGRSPPRG